MVFTGIREADLSGHVETQRALLCVFERLKDFGFGVKGVGFGLGLSV